jgi:hypothetical protein
MMSIGREVKLFISSIILIAFGIVLLVQYTGICNLQAVILNGQEVKSWDQNLGLRSNVPVIKQPIDSLASALLMQQGITHVDIQYRLPSMLMISTNNLDPVCYMIDRATGTFFGIDESGRVVPVDISQSAWDLPIFTGTRVRRLHDYTDDYRVNLVLPQILAMRQTNPSLFKFIEEVDFSHPNYVGLGLQGRGFRLRLPADRFLQRLDEFTTFVDRYHPPLDSTSSFDLSYDDVIIRVGAIPAPRKTVVDSEDVNDKSDFSDETDLEPVTQMDIPVRAAEERMTSEEVLAPSVDHADTPKPETPKVTPTKTHIVELPAAALAGQLGKPTKATDAVKTAAKTTTPKSTAGTTKTASPHTGTATKAAPTAGKSIKKHTNIGAKKAPAHSPAKKKTTGTTAKPSSGNKTKTTQATK